MGITVDWDNDQKTVVRYIFVDPWKWDQFYACWDWVKQALDASPHKVSAIVDLTGTNQTPADSLMHMRALIQQRHENFSEALIVVGAGKLGTIYGTIAQQVAANLRYRLFFTATLEEARRLLDDWNTQSSSESHDS